MKTGKTKWFNEHKGFGFIVPDEPGPDVFVHYSDIVSSGFRTLREGQPVEFEIRHEDRGPRATNVRPLEG